MFVKVYFLPILVRKRFRVKCSCFRWCWVLPVHSVDCMLFTVDYGSSSCVNVVRRHHFLLFNAFLPFDKLQEIYFIMIKIYDLLAWSLLRVKKKNVGAVSKAFLGIWERWQHFWISTLHGRTKSNRQFILKLWKLSWN